MGLNKRLIGAGAVGSGALTPSENFKVVTFTGDGTSSKFIEVGFTPDFVWMKGRNASSENKIIDSSRTAGCLIYTDLTNGNDCHPLHAVIETNGFNVKGNPNVSGREYVAWCWKANEGTTSSNTDGTITSTVQANQEAGFSIVTYTGNGTQPSSIGHGLNSAPTVVINKCLSLAGTNWHVYTSSTGATSSLVLNDTASAYTGVSEWNTAPDSTKIYVGNTNTNASGRSYISYCFTDIEGFSKFGTYTGNGSENGPIVETGFEPAFLMTKQTDDTSNWVIVDNKRSTTNPRDKGLRPNTSDSESTVSNNMVVDFLSNGFQLKQTSGANANNGNFIYIAFAADPDTEAPTVAKSFSTNVFTDNTSNDSLSVDVGFKPGLIWTKYRGGSQQFYMYDNVRSKYDYLSSNDTYGNQTRTFGIEPTENGFTKFGNVWNRSGTDQIVAWTWKADDNEPTILPNTELSSLISKYKFESNANDDYGDNNGTASNLSYVSGRFGKAADFNGSSSKILYPQAAPFNDSNTILSISAWVKLDSASDEFVIMSASSTSDSSDYGLLIVGGNRPGRVFLSDAPNNGNEYQATFGSGNDTNWNHYVWQLSSTNGIELWYNGVSQTRTSLVQNGSIDEDSWFGDLTYATSVQWATGINRVVTTGYYNGSIDQMRLFDAELTSSEISSLYNEANEAIVSANANAGFSIVKWTGDGVQGSKVSHGLSAAPELIIMKDLSATNHWVVGNSESGWTKAMHLDLTSADNASDLYWDDTAPTATVFSLGHHSTAYNVSGNEYIAYCFHSVSGYSKIGSYSGGSTGSSNVITTGFQPDWIMIKRTDTADDWTIMDSVRGDGASSKRIIANTNNAEKSATSIWFPTSTGFYFSGTGNSYNASGGTYIYMAFKIN